MEASLAQEHEAHPPDAYKVGDHTTLMAEVPKLVCEGVGSLSPQ